MAGQRTTGWLGWVWFAGGMCVMLGFFNAIIGLVALFNDTLYVAGQNNLLVFDITTWGWIHLVIGVLQLIGGFGLFNGRMRALVSLLLVVNAVAQMVWLPVYPVWSVLIIALDVVTLWAIIVHGGEARALARDDEASAEYRAGYDAGVAEGRYRAPRHEDLRPPVG